MQTTKINSLGDQTALTYSAAMESAKHKARYRHGEWFVWQHKAGEWYASNKAHAASIEDAALNVDPTSKVYLIGGGGPLSMVFTRFGADIIQMWERNMAVNA